MVTSAATDLDDCKKTLLNTATVSADNEDKSALGNNSDDGNIVVNCADVGVEKTPDPDPTTGAKVEVSAGNDAVFTIVVTNKGGITTTGVVLTDQLPKGAIASEILSPRFLVQPYDVAISQESPGDQGHAIYKFRRIVRGRCKLVTDCHNRLQIVRHARRLRHSLADTFDG